MKIVKWHKLTLLRFLQANPETVFAWMDFRDTKNWLPFLWYQAGARVSELKKMWFLEIVWKRKGKLKGTRNMFLYKITEEGKNFKV